MFQRCRLIGLLIGLTLSLTAWAEEPPYPRDMPLLTVIDAKGHSRAVVTLKDLETMQGHSVEGPIPGNTAPPAHWYGVSLKSLLETKGIKPPDHLLAGALNGYDEIIPEDDLERYDPIVAYLRDGHYIPVDGYGPLMLMYPYDSHPELQTSTYYNRTVWQLNTLRLP